MKSKFLISLALTFISFVFIFRESYSQMYWNQAASFAGNSSSYVSIPNSSSLDITGSFTLEARINPANLTGAKGIISKGGVLGTSLKYALRLFNGRILLATNGAQRIITKTSTSVPLNEWTHVAATFNSSSNLFSIYINGSLDTSAAIAGAAPTTNPDSLFIGISGASTPFNGKIDEIRVWNTYLSVIQIFAFRNSTIGGNGEFVLNNLVLSMPFQNNTGSGSFFSAMDHSNRQNNGFTKNVSAFDLKDRPSGTHLAYDCVNITNGYLTGEDTPSISPTSKMTFECWLFPKSDNYGLLYKGTYFSSNPDYGLKVSSGKLNAYINNTLIVSNDSVKKERWNHIAFTYFGATGRYEFFVDGKRGTTGNLSPGNINDGPDSLIVGAFPFTPAFTGYMDEVRITCDNKSISDINDKMFTSINESNDNDASLNAIYNLDASSRPNTDGGPILNLRGTISYNFNSAMFTSGILQSPVNNFSTGQFQAGYYLNMPNKRIPSSGTSGTTKDTIEILSPDIISDLNIYLALNHKKSRTLRLTLTNPIGASTEFFANTILKDSNNNIVTVFDSDADSSLTNNRYVSFGPKIKPQFDLDAIFSGSNAKGKWILTVNDDAASDTGLITCWGLQINNNTSLPFNLECTSLVEGFYNSASNLLIADTIRYYLRSSIFPYVIIDSSKAMVNSSGTAIASFTKAQQQENYFLVLKHRNSIETWSSSVIKFTQFSKQTQYNFTDLSSKAFGNNMRQVDSSPVKFAIYSGDIDRNGFVDLNDITLALNDASSFLSGYNITDVNGDNQTDLSDVLIVFNNSSSFVTSIVP